MTWQTVETWHVAGIGPLIIQRNGLETRHKINNGKWEYWSPHAPPAPKAPEPTQKAKKQKKPRMVGFNNELRHQDAKQVHEYLQTHCVVDVHEVSETLGLPVRVTQAILEYLVFHSHAVKRTDGEDEFFEAIHAA